MVSPPSPSAATTSAVAAPFKSTLSATAAPFVPSASWLPVAYDDECAYDDYDGGAYAHEIPDNELFDNECHPLTPEELLELEQVDEINAMLADLELMETHQELYQEHQKARALSSSSDAAEAELRNLAKKPTKHVDYYAKHSSAPRMPKKSFHMKKNVFAPIQQPRSVK